MFNAFYVIINKKILNYLFLILFNKKAYKEQNIIIYRALVKNLQEGDGS